MIIIPARLKSQRFPNKVLAQINGIPMVVRVANLAKEIDDVVVACDEQIIADVCLRYNIQAILTSNLHESGTDRIAECARILQLKNNEIIINLQGDEPFLEPSVIESLKHIMQKDEIPFMGTCAKVISEKLADNPNQVKVVINDKNEALYFSRSKIPFNRDDVSVEYLGHIGIYAFSGESLQCFCNLKKSPLESIEKLEQLRALENGKKIVVAKVASQSFGIDTKDDLELALKTFCN